MGSHKLNFAQTEENRHIIAHQPTISRVISYCYPLACPHNSPKLMQENSEDNKAMGTTKKEFP